MKHDALPPHAPHDLSGRDTMRVPYAVQVLVLHDPDAWLAEAVDLSHSGCGLFRPPGCRLEEGNLVRLCFLTDLGALPIVTARVARVSDRHLGFEYHEPQAIPPGPR